MQLRQVVQKHRHVKYHVMPIHCLKMKKEWMQQVVDQTIDRTFMDRYGTIQEQVNAIVFLASDDSSYMTGTVVPVGGGDQG